MSYTENEFDVLEGLDGVRHAPGMYTRTKDPLHIIQEVIDNACDEAQGGFAGRLDVTLHGDGSVTVADDGRGIPVGVHAKSGLPVVVAAYTRLHAGAKFRKREGSGAYKISGGLHGVGVAVTNALSKRVEVEVRREGKVHRVVFVEGDRQVSPVETIGTCGQKNTGTKARVWPDGRYFDSPTIPRTELMRLLRSKAALLPGLRVSFAIEGAARQEWCYTEGLAGYLQESLPAVAEGAYVSPVFAGERFITETEANASDFEAGEGCAWAVAWVEGGGNGGESFVNMIPTPLGGTHDNGLRTGLFESIREFCAHHALLPRNVTLQADDVWKNCRYVLAARIVNTQFQGQTKERLTTQTAARLISSRIKDPLDAWLNRNPEEAKKIAEMAIKAATARQKSVKVVEKKKSSGATLLPGKLTDCESTDIERNELFLVEGDSAGGSAKQGRDRECQAILPLRGKVLNTWEVDRGAIYGNAEVHDIAVALGIDPHDTEAPDSVLDGLRYGKVIIMSDADVDGSHIQALLLTLFFRHFPKLIERGHVFVGQPPLYCVKVAPHGKVKHERRIYALDEMERDGILEKLRADGVRETAVHVGRFKGLGEMNPDQLKETTMHPDARRLLPIRLPKALSQDAEAVFGLLMAKGESAGRKAWMERKGNLVEADV